MNSPSAATRWRTILYLALAAALVYAGVSAAGGFSDAFDHLHHISTWWLVPAAAAVTIRFGLLGMQLRFLRGDAAAPSVGVGIGVGLIAFGLGGLMPASPAEGFTLASGVLHRRGMSRRQAWLMLVSSQWVQFWALIVVFAIDRLVATAVGEVHHRHPWRTVATSAILLAVTAAAAWLVRRPSTARRLAGLTRWLPNQKRKSAVERAEDAVALHAEIRQTMGNRSNRFLVTFVSALCWIADAAVLWCMLAAVHAKISFELAIIGYVAAIVVSWVPLLPSGIGLVELAVPALLHHFHVPTAAGLAAVLLWRGVSLVAPAIAGFGCLVALRSGNQPGNQQANGQIADEPSSAAIAT